MKKIMTICLSLISILILGSIVKIENLFALSCNVELQSSQSTYIKEDEFFVTVSISNLQTENGIVALGAILDYDKTALDLKEVVGENKWVAQIGNNKSKIIAYSGKKVIKDEDVMKLTFIVKKDTTAKNTWVKISNFEISDGNEEIAADSTTLTLSIQDKQVPPEKEDTSNKNSSSSSTSKPTTSDNNDKPNNTNKEPITTNKPEEEKPDTNKEENKTPTQPTKVEENTKHKSSYIWVFIVSGMFVIIVIAILVYAERKNKNAL